jgi:hypothetical protein
MLWTRKVMGYYLSLGDGCGYRPIEVTDGWRLSEGKIQQLENDDITLYYS